MTTQRLQDFLNIESNDEMHMFITGTKKKTGQMIYQQFQKTALPIFREKIKKYLDEEVKPKMEACKTLDELNNLVIPALTATMKEEIIAHIDRYKTLNLVEKTYLALDLIRGVDTNIRTLAGHMVMHYATIIKSGARIITPSQPKGGGRIIIP